MGVRDKCAALRGANHLLLPCAFGEGTLLCGAGLGMNEDELKRNIALTEWTVKDLNEGDT